MSRLCSRYFSCCTFAVCFLLLCCTRSALAQAITAPGTLAGTVSDQSGARVRKASVHAAGPAAERDAITDSGGAYSLSLAPGEYQITISAPGFDSFEQSITLKSGGNQRVDAVLTIATQTATVDVPIDSAAPNTSASENRSALVLGADKLATLSDDDATLQQQVLAMAGSDGEHAPQVYVDGFSGGSFPPKSSIREIRINQNPFSAQYDSLGFGRVEILTKPGTGQLHGEFDQFGNDSSFNSPNPFLNSTNTSSPYVPLVEPPYYRWHTVGNLSGPIGKKSSFFVSADYFDSQNNAIINAQTVDPSGNEVSVSQAVPDPTTTSDYTLRLDRQLATNDTLTSRYEFNRVNLVNGGIGPGAGFSLTSTENVLPSEAYNSLITMQTSQLGETHIFNVHAELESRFQWIRTRSQQLAVSNAPTVLVQGTVNAGGSPNGNLRDNSDQFEWQEYASFDFGKHFVRAGGRLRAYRDANYSTANYNGEYTFDSLDDYSAAQKLIASGATSAPNAASQFQITTGNPNAEVSTLDLGLYAEDEWKARKDLTIDYGARFETQTAIPDHFDPSPHFGIAWAIHQKDNKPAHVVLRGGAALFYDRFAAANLLTAVRLQSGTVQQAFTATSAAFCPSTPQGCSVGAGAAPTRTMVAPGLRSEYNVNAGGGMELSLGKWGQITTNYIFERGIHQWVSINANAPLANGTRPLGNTGDLYEFTSNGDSLSHFAFTNPQLNLTKKIHLWGFLVLHHSNSDTTGAGNFASNSYNVHQDYGRAIWDRRHAAFTGADADLKWGLSVGAFLAARGGQPFNITTGADNNGDTQYNDRPAFATAATDPANLRVTRFGNFDIAPTAGERPIPIDYGHSPGFMSLQMQVSETVKFGPRKAPADAPPPPPGQKAPLPDPRYTLNFSVEAQNVTNTSNPASPIGALSSPYFGQSISSANSFVSTSAANRTIMLHTGFRF